MKIADFSPQSQSERARAGFRILIRSDPVFLHGSGSGFQISLDPDPVLARILEQKRVQRGL